MWWLGWGALSGLAVFSFLVLIEPDLPLPVAISAGMVATVISLLGAGRLWRQAKTREAVIHEQVQFVEARHEELREAYLEQEKIQVELRRKVNQLTTLHSAGLLFGSTLDRETLLQNVLQTLIHQLHYDRAMISRFDPERQVSYDSRVIGVSEDIAAYAQSHEVPVTDPNGFEGTVLLQGKPLLVGDIRETWDRLHPRNQQLATMTNAKSVIAVPLKVKDRILGALTVDRTREHSLTEDDLALMETLANQVAIALDNAAAYQEIEVLNAGLEEKIRERTVQLEAANQQLIELNQIKSAFVSMVSHELRTPMTSMRIYVSNMLDGVIGTLTDKQKQYLSRIEFNIDRLTRMIVDLLDLSRIEAGRVDLRLGAIAVQEFAEEVVESLRSLVAGKSITLECAVACPMPLQADRDKLTQILTNLIANAIKYTSTGGKVRVTSELAPDEEALRFCVSDTGCGIQPEEVPKVFEKFFRGMANTAETRGAGLGLAIVKSLVELHGGRVWVESTVGQGTSVYFTLPLIRVGS
jgi:signal transduction histidine kinase